MAFDPGWFLKVNRVEGNVYFAVNGLLNGWLLDDEGRLRGLDRI